MEMKCVILLLYLFHLVSAFRPVSLQFTGDSKQLKDPLCEIGCKCPEEGQSFSYLDCSSRGIAHLPTSLQIQNSITSMSFQSNHLKILRISTFSRADDVQELDFSLNQIDTVENFTFAPFKSLALLRLSHNRLSYIHPGLLGGLSNLRILELGHNAIQSLSHIIFQQTPNLQELRLQYNPVFELSDQLFQYLPKLEKLDLEDTGLVRLPENIFIPTPRLHWLSLSNNAFENVPEESLSHAPMLENLDLSSNDFTILVKGSFRRLSSISLLYLNNLNRLSRIEKDALVGLVKLKSLSCSYNPKLDYMDEDAFGNKNSTIKSSPSENLYLRQNALRTLKSPLELASWPSLSFVDLADNPWKCDCNLRWMKLLKKETQMTIVCESPPHLRGRSLHLIDTSELQCEDRWALASFILVISSMIAFGVIMLGATAIVCSRTRLGLCVRAKRQFGYAKVVPKTETVDLEWDPSADM